MSNLLKITAICMVALCVNSFGTFGVERCAWYYNVTCPISGGSSPICGMENPKRLEDGTNLINICASENPNLFGGSFDVMVNFPGKVLEITRGGISNCGFGTGEGTQSFFSHCESKGSDRMFGLWQIKYNRNVTSSMEFEKEMMELNKNNMQRATRISQNDSR